MLGNRNRRSQGILERPRGIAGADPDSDEGWTALRVDSERPDGRRVTVCLSCSLKQAGAWRKEAKWKVAKRYEALRQLAIEVPSKPPERPKDYHWDRDTLDMQEAQRLAAWQRGYLCGRQKGDSWEA